MPTKLQLVGRKFGKLTVVREHPQRADDGGVKWECVCDCGNTATTMGKSLIHGGTTSCGCAYSEPRTHGDTGSKLYQRWRGMIQRTSDKNYSEYVNYGGRGIRVCDRWKYYENFKADMGASFSPSLEIDRKDVDGQYSPDNCRWVTRREQQRNKRTNHKLSVGGETLTLVEWGERTGIKANTILTRIRRGWPTHRLLMEIANS